MTNVAAAIGVAQLENFDQHLADRSRVYSLYNNFLAKLERFISLPITRTGFQSVCWLYTVVLNDAVAKSRDEVMAEMSSHGIETRPVFYPMHQLPPYYTVADDFPIANQLSLRGMSLPTHGALREEEVEFICEILAKCLTST
jgi:perosamine synthetase